MAASRSEFSEETVEGLSRHARLDLTSERREVVVGALGLVYGLVDGLDALDLADVPPATAFDPRWV